jgi:hypothetical protein
LLLEIGLQNVCFDPEESLIINMPKALQKPVK